MVLKQQCHIATSLLIRMLSGIASAERKVTSAFAFQHVLFIIYTRL